MENWLSFVTPKATLAWYPIFNSVKSEGLTNNTAIRTGYMAVPSDSFASLSCFQFGDSKVWWDFQTLCNAQWLFLQQIHWIAKATEPSVQSLALWRPPNWRLPDTGTINQGCIAVLFSKTAGQVQSSVCWSSAHLVKFKRCSKAEGVVLCHRAVCCRLSPSWNSTVDDWRWQTKQEALSLVSAKDTNPEAVVSECWGVLMGGSCPVLVSEVCDTGAVWMYCAVKRRRQWLLRKRLWMVHSIFPCVIVFSVHSWIIKKVTVSETSPKCQLVIFLPISFPESYALFLLTSALFDKKKKSYFQCFLTCSTFTTEITGTV